MNFKQPQNPTLDAVSSLLQPCTNIPLTGTLIVAAFRSYSPDNIVSKKKSPDQLLALKDVAKRLNCSKRTARRLVDAGKIDRIMIGNRSLRVKESELERFLSEGGV